MKLRLNLSLAKKIGLMTTIGLLLAVAAFSFLAMRAVNQATEAMLQDRMTTAHLVADYLDETLSRALTEVGATAKVVSAADPAAAAPRLAALEGTFSRLSITTEGVYLVNDAGNIVWCSDARLTGSGSPAMPP